MTAAAGDTLGSGAADEPGDASGDGVGCAEAVGLADAAGVVIGVDVGAAVGVGAAVDDDVTLLTVTLHVAEMPSAVAVIVALPTLTAVTLPL